MAKDSLKKPKISEVVSIVGHQLKSPLSVIKGYLEVLLSGDCGKVNVLQKEYLHDALENVDRMRKNIDDLLIVQRIEDDRYELNVRPISLESIAFKVLSDFALWARALNCEINFKHPEKLPLCLGDPQAIREVIENFISNAIKYSRGRGKVEITLSLARKGNHLIFNCKDNGISIPKREYKKVFRKFYRSEEAMEIDPSGAGLGLYINKSIVKACGGKIWFAPNKPFGMIFSFSIPIAK